MLEQLTQELSELKVEARAIESRQGRLERSVETLTDTPINRVRKLHERLRKLLADGKANRNNFSCPTHWAEVEDLVEDLVPVKRRLPGRLFWHVYLPLKDSRRRLEENPFDNHAVNQLEYVEKVLVNAVNKLESV